MPQNTYTITQAVTHISLDLVNESKLAQLDAVAEVYLDLCQQYVTYFCTEAEPDKYTPIVFESELSQRWQRVAIQQASGIAQSWRSNRDKAFADYERRFAWFEKE